MSTLKDQLIGGIAPASETITVRPGVSVTVRGLTRVQMLAVNDYETVTDKEAWMLHCALVDPALTFEEAQAWERTAPAGEIEPVTLIIQRLSGMDEGAGKRAYKSVRGRSRS